MEISQFRDYYYVSIFLFAEMTEKPYFLIKICSLDSSVLYMKIELLNFCEGLSYFLWNRDWVPVVKAAIVSILIKFLGIINK